MTAKDLAEGRPEVFCSELDAALWLAQWGREVEVEGRTAEWMRVEDILEGQQGKGKVH